MTARGACLSWMPAFRSAHGHPEPASRASSQMAYGN
ncbi:hypothetical protein X946_5308 [Burkholderia sp. ABCPW 111]|nr:hypothetical protein X946_5308 [Burkholderia sp. ABCPW 111]